MPNLSKSPRRMKFAKLFGKSLGNRRRGKNLTKQELADKINMSLSAISRYESGERVPDLISAYELTWALDWSLDDLMIDIIYRDRHGSD